MIAEFAGVHLRRGRRGAARARRPRGQAETKLWFFPRALGRGYSAAGGRADLGGARGVRVVRLLQGPRRGVRAADLPVGLAQGALPGALPGRRAHPRPGHVPQAADPRRRPPVRHRRARPRRQRHRRRSTSSSGVDADRGRSELDGRPTTAPMAALRHPAGAGRGEGDQRGRGGADRRRPALPLAHRLLAPRPGVPAGGRAAGAGRRLRHASTASASTGGRAPPQPGHPARPAAPGRRARPVRPGHRPGRPRPGWRSRVARPAVAGRRTGAAARRGRPQQHRPARPRGGAAAERHALADAGVWAQAAAQSQATPPPRPVDVGPARPRPRRRAGRGRGLRAAGDDDAEERVRAELEILGLDVSRHVVDFYAGSSTRSASPAPRPAPPAQPRPSCWSPGSRSPPRPRRSGRPPGRLPDPRRRHRPVDATFFEDAQGPYAATVFGSWLLVVRGELRRTGRRGRLAAGHRRLGAAGAARAVAARGHRRGARAMAGCPRASPGRRRARSGAAEPVHPPVMAHPAASG